MNADPSEYLVEPSEASARGLELYGINPKHKSKAEHNLFVATTFVYQNTFHLHTRTEAAWQ